MVVLQLNNLSVVGGVTMASLALAKAFPGHRHVVAFQHRHPLAPLVLELCSAAGVEGRVIGGKFTMALLNDVRPDLVIANNIGLQDMHPIRWGALSEQIVTVDYARAHAVNLPATYRVWNSKFTAAMSSGVDGRIVGSLIDTDDFAVPERTYDNRLVGMLGTVNHEHRADEGLAAMLLRARFRRPQLQVSLANMRQLIVESDWITTPDYVGKPAASFYRSLGIYIHSTRADIAETWCRSITEAMASGLPILAERKGAIPEQIDDEETGLLFSTRDEFVDKLIRLYDDEGLRRALGAAAKQKAQAQFGLPSLRAAFQDIFEEAARRRSRRRHALQKEKDAESKDTGAPETGGASGA